MLSKIAAALGVPVARGDYSGVPPNRPDQGAPANYAPFGAMDGSNLLGDDGAPALFTAGEEFGTVSRGDPVIQEMDAEAQLTACLTEETWRLEITADAFAEQPHAAEAATLGTERTREGGNAIDLPALRALAETEGVSLIKAMQCLNVEAPLGQGLWYGVPLSAVLRHFCASVENVRRVDFWGYHNNDESQRFSSSVSYTEAFEPSPGDPPVMLAFALNGGPVPLGRGGPVRMVVPHAHGFKSVKWLTNISVTNDYRASDTYASLDGMNDPASHLKTAAYLDRLPSAIKEGESFALRGIAMSGRTPLARVEYWLRPVEPLEVTGELPPLPDDAPELLAAPWQPCTLQPPPPDWSAALPDGTAPSEVFGFGVDGAPTEWPMRYGYVGYSAKLSELAPGEYELRARAVDAAGNAQPLPRPQQKSGRNSIQCHRFAVQ